MTGETRTIELPPGAEVLIVEAVADATVTRADGTIKEG